MDSLTAGFKSSAPHDLVGRWSVKDEMRRGQTTQPGWATVEIDGSGEVRTTTRPADQFLPNFTVKRAGLYEAGGRRFVWREPDGGLAPRLFGFWKRVGEELELRFSMGYTFPPDNHEPTKIEPVVRMTRADNSGTHAQAAGVRHWAEPPHRRRT